LVKFVENKFVNKLRRNIMVGKTSARRQPVPDTAADISIQKFALGRKTTVPIAGSGAELHVKTASTLYNAKNPVMVVRRKGRGGGVTSLVAQKLAGCKGKDKSCIEGVLGISTPKGLKAGYVKQVRPVRNAALQGKPTA
jgi:hypothetical protein